MHALALVLAAVLALLTGIAAGPAEAHGARAGTNRSAVAHALPADRLRTATKHLSPRLSAATLSIHWLAPSDGTDVTGVLSGSTCQVATQDSVRIMKVNFSLDGSLISTATGPPYSCRIDTSVLSPGTHILKAKAYDLLGNVLSDYSFVTVPSTGAPPTTVTMQGDSLTAGSWWRVPPYLGPSFQLLSVSAHIGRPAITGATLLRRQPLGRVVVFALGTNDWWDTPSAYRDDLTNVLRFVGPSRCVVVATIWRKGRPMSALNRILWSLAKQYGPQRIQVAPWAEAVGAGRVRTSDGTHPVTQGGWQLRAQLVADAVRACASGIAPPA